MRRIAILTALLLGLVGCSTATESLPADVTIDVRTSEEFASGHLEGAINMDVTDAGFAEALESLDPEDSYAVYCRSGNRSAQAAALMQSAGLTVTDLGSLENAADRSGTTIVR